MKTISVIANDANLVTIMKNFMQDCFTASFEGTIEHHAHITVIGDWHDENEVPRVLLQMTIAVDIAAAHETIEALAHVLSEYDTAGITLTV